MITTTSEGKFLTSPVTWDEIASYLPDSWQPSAAQISSAHKAQAVSSAHRYVDLCQPDEPGLADDMVTSTVWIEVLKSSGSWGHPTTTAELTGKIQQAIEAYC